MNTNKRKLTIILLSVSIVLNISTIAMEIRKIKSLKNK